MGKPAPNFWWDFNQNDVIVQSDDPGGQCLARFTVKDGCAEAAIDQAEKLIADYKAGRKTPVWSKELQ